MKKLLWTLAALLFAYAGQLQAQVLASFSLSANSTTVNGTSVPGWTNVYGDPHLGPLSATANGITLSSISQSNWLTDASGICAEDGAAPVGGTFFPDHVLRNHWFQAGPNASFNQAYPQIRLSGLNKDSFYIIRMSSSSNYTVGDPTQYTVAGNTVYPSQNMYPYNNLATGVTFQHIYPDSTGVINIYVNTTPGKNVAYLAGVQIITGSSTVGIPTVAITSPENNDILAEETNVTINASASEPGSSISKVEFYSDTVKIGESDTAPYSFTWVNPDAGHYTIKAKATDISGASSTASINISIEPLSSFWSLTGNIAANGDSNFVGTVDTNRLAFRTNNLERMSISKGGNVTIGGKDTASYPAFRVYPNGDLAAGTTMDASVNTLRQSGLRYYSKLGLLQIGSSDRLDTTVSKFVYANYPGSGILINSDESNSIKGRIYSSYVSGDQITIDSNYSLAWTIASGENFRIRGSVDHSIISGWGHNITSSLSNSAIVGQSHQILNPMTVDLVNGYYNTAADTTRCSLVSGAVNQFGGLSQLVSGQYLVNRTPYGVALGNANVDFATLPYTGIRGTTVANIGQYPLLALGNSADVSGQVRSNALTILYNGRTQINAAGFTNTLAQADVTPKAALEVISTNTGVLLPRLTNAQRNSIASGDLQNGLLLYNTDSSTFQYYNGSAWNSVGSGSGSGSGGRWLFSTGTNGTVYDSLDNVAIGTGDSRGYKLAVKGSALFTRIQVFAASNWPDYVFKRGYRLRSLEELESYIDKHKHLPEIASAAKVGAEGLDLGANQAAILKKVEELTLYLIDENKQLKAQTSQIAEQNKKIAEQDRQIAEQDARFQEQQRQIDELKALIKKK